MRKTTFPFLLLTFFLCLNGLGVAKTENYQLVGSSDESTVYFDTQTIKIMHDDEINQDYIDLWIKKVFNDTEWKKNYIAVMKMTKKGYKNFSYQLIHMQYLSDGKQRRLMGVDYTTKDENLGEWTTSPVLWEVVPNDPLENSTYKAVMKYVDENKEAIKERK